MFLKKIPLHPLLVALYPGLALLAHNLGQVSAQAAVRSLVLSLLLAILLLLALRLIARDWHMAAAAATFLLALFFSYGHIYTFLETNTSLGRHRLLVPLWILLAIVGLWWVFKKMRQPESFTLGMNLVALFAVAMPLAQMLAFDRRQVADFKALDQNAPQLASQLKPDVYYIILDGYPRDDVVQEDFGYDNGPFLAELEKLGFVIPRCAQSNYASTEQSLPSSLNFDYLDALTEGADPSADSLSQYWPWLKYSRVRQGLEALGYQTVAFETGFHWSEITDAGVYLSRRPSLFSNEINSFEALFFKTTAAFLFTDAAAFLPPAMRFDVDAYDMRLHYERALFTLNEMESVPQSVQSPKFVFAHIIAPHRPFVFGADGQFVLSPKSLDDPAYRTAGRDEIAYLNQRVIGIARSILANSQTPPIIVIQGDHGHRRTTDEKHMDILNAYFLPGGADLIYPDITPVNSFRVIFNRYFGTSYPLLEDVSYYSRYEDPFNYEIVGDSREDCP